MANDLDACAKRFAAQGRMTITKSEQKQRNLASEMNANRSELAHVKAEAQNAVNIALKHQNVCFANAETMATNAVLRAQSLKAEIRSVKTEADEIAASRFENGFEAEINLEFFEERNMTPKCDPLVASGACCGACTAFEPPGSCRERAKLHN